MKRLLTTTAFALALVSSAYAADYEVAYGKWQVKYVSSAKDTHKRLCTMMTDATNDAQAVIMFKTSTSDGDLQVELARADWSALQNDKKYAVGFAFNGQWVSNGNARVVAYTTVAKSLATNIQPNSVKDFLGQVGNASSMWIGFQNIKTWNVDRVGAADAVKAFLICAASLPEEAAVVDLPRPPASDANRAPAIEFRNGKGGI